MNIPEAYLEGLHPYRVSLEEDSGDSFTLLFDCFAEDGEHAIEQALDAYPHGVIKHCGWFDFRDLPR